MTQLSVPAAAWHEPPTPLSAPGFSRLYWHFDAATETWTLMSGPGVENGRIQRIADGVYTLVHLEDLDPDEPTKRIAKRRASTSVPPTTFVY